MADSARWTPGPPAARRSRTSRPVSGRRWLACSRRSRSRVTQPARVVTADRPHVAGYRTGPGEGPWSVVVGHDGVFKVLLLTLFDLPLERFWMWSFDLPGICVIEIRGGRPLVRAMNLVEHLAPVLDEAARAETDERRRAGAL